jgi:DNA-directed RNA polymerase specialized sigma24 family protein
MALQLTEGERALLADASAEADLTPALYDRLQQGARRGLAMVLGAANVEEADVEDAVVKAFAQWLGKPPEQRQAPLAFHIAMRRGQDLGGHIVRRRPAVASGDNAEPGTDDDFGLDPLDAVLLQEQLDDALACLDTLTDNQRAYVEDVIMNGQPESDWADQRDISQQAANKTKLSALRRLRTCVKARPAGNDGGGRTWTTSRWQT